MLETSIEVESKKKLVGPESVGRPGPGFVERVRGG